MYGAMYQFWLFGGHALEGVRLGAQIHQAISPNGEVTGGVDGEDELLTRPRTGALGVDPAVIALNTYANCLWQTGQTSRASTVSKEALRLSRSIGDKVGEAHTLMECANIAQIHGELLQGGAFTTESVAILRRHPDAFGLWRALGQYGDSLSNVGRYDDAETAVEEALSIARSLGHPWGVARNLYQIGRFAFARGDLERAATMFEESLVWYAKMRAVQGPHWSHASLGAVALERGDFRRAAGSFAASLTLARRTTDLRTVSRCIDGIAAAILSMSDGDDRRIRTHVETATKLLGAADALRTTIEVVPGIVERPVLDAALALAHARLDDKAFSAAWNEGRGLSQDGATDLALGLVTGLQDWAPDTDTVSV